MNTRRQGAAAPEMDRGRPALHHRLLAGALTCALASGCTATLTLADGRRVEGCIRGADARALYVAPAPPREPGVVTMKCTSAPVRLEYASVRDVDHPGGPAIGLGVILLASGAIFFTAGFMSFHPDYLRALGGTGAGLSVAGTAVMSVGFGTWARSVAAAQIPKSLPPPCPCPCGPVPPPRRYPDGLRR